jgi:hypothetical protein
VFRYRSRDQRRAARIGEIERSIGDVRVEVDVPAVEADWILADEALELGMVVARPRVTPSASSAGKSTLPPMRVSAMRPERG